MNRILKIAVAVLAVVAVLGLVGCGRTQNQEVIPQTSEVEASLPVESVGEGELVVTEPDETQSTETLETEATEPVDTTVQTTAPEETTESTGTGETTASTTPAMSDWERYNNMSAAEQQAFFESFANPQDYFDWINAAKKEHEENSNDIVVGEDGKVDLGDLIGGQNP